MKWREGILFMHTLCLCNMRPNVSSHFLILSYSSQAHSMNIVEGEFTQQGFTAI